MYDDLLRARQIRFLVIDQWPAARAWLEASLLFRFRVACNFCKTGKEVGPVSFDHQ